MTRECHVRFWERAGVRFPRATRQVVISIAGRKHWLWRAVDQHGVVLDILVQSRRNAKAAKRLLRKLLKKQGIAPRVMITDKLASYGAAKREIMPGVEHRQHQGFEQSSGEQPSADPTTRAHHEALQVSRAGPTLSLRS